MLGAAAVECWSQLVTHTSCGEVVNKRKVHMYMYIAKVEEARTSRDVSGACRWQLTLPAAHLGWVERLTSSLRAVHGQMDCGMDVRLAVVIMEGQCRWAAGRGRHGEAVHSGQECSWKGSANGLGGLIEGSAQ